MALEAPAFDETSEVLNAPAFEDTSEVTLSPPAFEDTQDVPSETPVTASNLSSLALSGAAEGGLQIVSGATRVAQTLNPRLFGFLDTVAKEAGLATTGEFLGELEGATSRAEDEYGVDPKQKGFLPTLAKAAGSTLPTLASGPFAPYTTGLMMGEQGLEEAQQYGGDETQQAKAFLGNAATGFVTEKLLGLPAAMKSVKEAAKKVKMPDGTFRDLVKSVVKQIGLGFAREGSQETLEQLSQDTIAKYVSAYDPDRKVFDLGKLTTTFIAGGILGSGISGGLHIAENVSPESIAPKEEMQTQAEQIDQTLSNLAGNQITEENVPAGEPEAKPTSDEAAKTLQPYFNQAVEVARAAGALDPESAASQAQIDLSNQVGEGTTTLDNPKALLLEAAQNQARKQIEKEQAQKRGGGKVSTVEELPEVEQTRGPRAELVSKEEVGSIQEAVSRMPEGDQKVMRAMMEDPTLTLAELAEQTGLSEDQVSRAKRNAREALKQFVRSQGIGERMAPGASNIQELRRAQYIAASDIYEGLRQSGQLSKETWERNMNREYEDTFTPEQLDQVWTIAQEASEQHQEAKGRKPFPAIISELIGITTPQGGTVSLANKRVDLDRRARGLPAAMEAAHRQHTAVWEEAIRQMEENKQVQYDLINRLRENPQTAINDTEAAMLLHKQIELTNEYDKAVEKINKAESESAKLSATQEAREAEADLIEILDLGKQAGSVSARALAFRNALGKRDYSLDTLTQQLRVDNNGEALTPEQQQLVKEVSDKLPQIESKIQTRETELEDVKSQEAFEETVKELNQRPILDSRILAIANKIVSKLDSAADAARKRIKARQGSLNMALNPIELYDHAVVGASYIARGLRDIAWKSAMKKEFGNISSSDLDDIYKASDKMIDDLEQEAPEKDRSKVRNVVRKEGSKDVLKDTQAKIKARIEEGKELKDLRPYVKKMALALVRSGVTESGPLLDTMHTMLEPLEPGISKREVRDLISGYGDFHELYKETAKVQLRDIQGQMQQVSKLEDIRAKQPLQKTGVERRQKSDTERRLEKQVNEAKKKYGVVTTDPARQLKSTLDTIKTNLRNQISDLTNQFETGEKPVPGTPTPTDQQVEKLRATRDALKKTLQEIEGKPEMTDEQRVKLAEQSLERSISDLENKLKNKDTSQILSKAPESDKLKALRAKRDSLRADLDALRSADKDLQDTKAFDRVMKSVEELQGKLTRGDIKPETKAARIEDELVTQAREKLQNLQDQMREARRSSPEGQKAKLDSAIKAVEASIAAYDERLKAGNVAPGTKPTVSSPTLDRLRSERDAMRKLVSDLRKGPPLSPEEVSLKMYRARLERQNADLLDRLARGDFSTKARKPLDISKDPEAVRLFSEKQQLLKRYEKARYEARLNAMSKGEKALHYTGETLNAAKSSVGSLDVSAFLRQAFFPSMAHPVIATKNLIRSIKAMNEGQLRKYNAQIASRPNARNGSYAMTGIQFTDIDGPLSKREETFRSDLAEKWLPHVRWSGRQYNTFLNLMRADLADIMIKSVPISPTKKELRAAGKAINIFTGRGELGSKEHWADALSFPLWAPRLYASRLQALVGQPALQKDAGRMRKVIAKEYVRALGSGVVTMILGLLAGAKIERDPSSSDYGKLRFGNLRIDPWGGHQQWLVFLTRILSGKYKTAQGEKVDLGKPKGPLSPNYGDTAGRMFRSKLNPIAGAIWDYKTGKDLGGNKVDAAKAIGKTVLPLSVFNDDIAPVAKEFGYDKAALVEILNLLGVGVQHYSKDKKSTEYRNN